MEKTRAWKENVARNSGKSPRRWGGKSEGASFYVIDRDEPFCFFNGKRMNWHVNGVRRSKEGYCDTLDEARAGIEACLRRPIMLTLEYDKRAH